MNSIRHQLHNGILKVLAIHFVLHVYKYYYIYVIGSEKTQLSEYFIVQEIPLLNIQATLVR